MGTKRIFLVDDLFHEVLAVAPASREAFLDERCGHDPVLREELRSLLRADARAGAFLSAGPVAPRPVDPAPPEAWVGRMVGAFRIDGLLATGGMGTVFRGSRADRQFEQQVAIKVVRADIASPALVRRFEHERQALADLNHPGIAHLLDGGATEDGLPYLVLEFIDGLPIDRYCDDSHLPIRGRLSLFLDVCEAVEYAHRHLVVHRDLKPANILVTADGQPKLVDFGIAKLLEGNPAQRPVEHTVALYRLLTPRYASPEQVFDQPVTTASDVYALGVILYELLTGAAAAERTPGEPWPDTVGTASATFDAGRGRDAEDIASRAARRGGPAVLLRRNLSGDLDAIVKKATAREPANRYASVEQLAADIRRFLTGQPIEARPASWSYRLVKAAGRNRLATASLSGLFVVLIVGVVLQAAATSRSRRAERQAQAERAGAVASRMQAERVSRFLRDTIGATNPYRLGGRLTLVNLLEETSRRIDAELSDIPAAAAEVHYTLGQVYSNLWAWKEARAHAERALELTRATHPEDDPLLADCLVLYGRALTFYDDPEAERAQRTALAIRRKRFGEDDPRTAEAKVCLGFALWDAARPPRFKESERCYREGIATYEATLKGPDRRLAVARFSLGALMGRLGRLEEAETCFRSSIAVFDQLTDTNDRYWVACQMYYAQVLLVRGRLDEARRVFERAAAATPQEMLERFPEAHRRQWQQLSRSLGVGGLPDDSGEAADSTSQAADRNAP